MILLCSFLTLKRLFLFPGTSRVKFMMLMKGLEDGIEIAFLKSFCIIKLTCSHPYFSALIFVVISIGEQVTHAVSPEVW